MHKLLKPRKSMTYDFDEIIKRRDTNSVKWDLANKDVLPMWVADMDFKAAEPIITALKKRVEHGIYGYSITPNDYYEAICAWWDKRHGWKLKKDWIIYSPGVVPTLRTLVRAFTKPGDKVIIQSPVYHPFYKVVENNGCEIVDNPLQPKDGTYVMDYEDLEMKASDEKAKMIIICSPHNPVGRVWKPEELKRLGEICLRHNVLIVSDEIHCDLIFKGYKHLPFASISESFMMNSITCTSPSKTFNIAGLQASNIIIPNPELRERVKAVMEASGFDELNIFGIEATIAAYKYGEDWLEQLLVYLGDNLKYLIEYIGTNMPMLKVINTEGTYLVWIDCRTLKIPTDEFREFFIKEAKVWLNQGHIFGEKGDGYVRINIACPRELLKQGLKRMEKAILSLEN